ncbi:MAG: hypothetical protein IKC66_08640, partial [Alistipes sp.]|nr:hypothetical protein [Alistipes sp.]
MQGNNRAKLHIFFHLTTLKRNYYVFWRIKTLFLQFFRRRTTLLHKTREPAPQKKREPANYDEYRYNLAEINHNPYVLTSYLTVKYEDYTRAEVQSELQALFDKQYELELEEEVEIRTRTETRTGTTSYTDPETGETTEEEYEYEVE